MFSNKRYLTKGIAEELPLELQIYIWGMIDKVKKDIKLDYLQVFKLEAVKREGVLVQQITHTQEIPYYKNSVVVRIETPINNRKIFCIDDISHSTMLFSEEY